MGAGISVSAGIGGFVDCAVGWGVGIPGVAQATSKIVDSINVVIQRISMDKFSFGMIKRDLLQDEN